MKVQFHSVEEFLEEITLRGDEVAGRSVRTTTVRRPAFEGALTQLSIMATAKVLSRAYNSESDDYDLVEYVEYVGDLWGHAKDDEVAKKAKDALSELEDK